MISKVTISNYARCSLKISRSFGIKNRKLIQDEYIQRGFRWAHVVSTIRRIRDQVGYKRVKEVARPKIEITQ